jgi:hypothetical protein
MVEHVFTMHPLLCTGVTIQATGASYLREVRSTSQLSDRSTCCSMSAFLRGIPGFVELEG